MQIKPVILVGKYVWLEPTSEAHIPGLTRAGTFPEIWRYMVYGVIENEEQMRQWVQDLLLYQARGTDLPFTVFQQETKQIVGATRYLDIRPGHRSLEIGGTWVSPDYQRTRVNTECKYLLLQHAFETLGCVRVQFKTDSRNLRSQNALERIGAIREGVLRRQTITPDGYIRDSVFFSIIDQEWPAVKEKLERKLYGNVYPAT